jgi:hypothetical protein
MGQASVGYDSDMSMTATEPMVQDECFRCGYDLRGIANDQPCPECGLLAERSRRVTDELHNSRPRWLRRLSLGVWLMLGAILLALAWPWAANTLFTSILRSYAWAPPMWVATLLQRSWIAGFDLAALLILIAAFLVTTPEQYAPADRGDRVRRVFLRICAAAPLLAMLFQHFMIELERRNLTVTAPSYELTPLGKLWVVVPILLTVGCLPYPLLLFYQLRSLAKRARSAHLAEHCAIVGFGMSFSPANVGVMLLIFETSRRWARDTYWTTRGNASLLLMLFMTLLATLMVLWSLYLLVRFAIAFGKASRELRRKWKLHDRAAETPAS